MPSLVYGLALLDCCKFINGLFRLLQDAYNAILWSSEPKLANTAHSVWYLCSNSESELIDGMKKYNYPICGLFIIALAYFTFSGCETTSTGPSGSTAHLTVQRGPKFGSRSVLAVMVDGARVASLTEGQAYNGTLSPGQHVISVSVSGPTRFANPTKTVMAEKGQTYSFTATWQGKHLVLL
jgi:hypothetical protein